MSNIRVKEVGQTQLQMKFGQTQKNQFNSNFILREACNRRTSEQLKGKYLNGLFFPKTWTDENYPYWNLSVFAKLIGKRGDEKEKFSKDLSNAENQPKAPKSKLIALKSTNGYLKPTGPLASTGLNWKRLQNKIGNQEIDALVTCD